VTTRPTPADVIARRRADRAALIAVANAFADRLSADLDVCAVIVFGSVARGDFHDHSDIDVLVVARALPEEYEARLAAVGWPGGDGVEAVVWTPAEYRWQRSRGNPIAVEAEDAGVWVVGDRTAVA
jgi:hypothetical protein